MTPLERAAHAIRDNLPLDSGTDPPDVEMLIDVARAVLTAIREPSQSMIMAGRGTLLEGERKTIEGWQAMIDAALAEQG